MTTIRKNEIGLSRVKTVKGECQLLTAYRPHHSQSQRAPASYTLSRERALSHFNRSPRMAVTPALCNTMRVIKIEQIHSKIVLAGLIWKKDF